MVYNEKPPLAPLSSLHPLPSGIGQKRERLIRLTNNQAHLGEGRGNTSPAFKNKSVFEQAIFPTRACDRVWGRYMTSCKTDTKWS